MSFDMTEYIAQAKANVVRNLRRDRELTGENLELRAAQAANERAHGYTAKHGEDGYVEYRERNADFRKVDSTIQSRFEGIGEELDELHWKIALALHSLSRPAFAAMIELIAADLGPQTPYGAEKVPEWATDLLEAAKQAVVLADTTMLRSLVDAVAKAEKATA